MLQNHDCKTLKKSYGNAKHIKTDSSNLEEQKYCKHYDCGQRVDGCHWAFLFQSRVYEVLTQIAKSSVVLNFVSESCKSICRSIELFDRFQLQIEGWIEFNLVILKIQLSEFSERQLPENDPMMYKIDRCDTS